MQQCKNAGIQKKGTKITVAKCGNMKYAGIRNLREIEICGNMKYAGLWNMREYKICRQAKNAGTQITPSWIRICKLYWSTIRMKEHKKLKEASKYNRRSAVRFWERNTFESFYKRFYWAIVPNACQQWQCFLLISLEKPRLSGLLDKNILVKPQLSISWSKLHLVQVFWQTFGFRYRALLLMPV